MTALLPTPLSPSRTALHLVAWRLLLSSERCILYCAIAELMEQESFSLEALVFLLNLTIYVLAAYFIQQKRIALLHESAIAVCLGLITALFIKYAMGKEIAFRDEYFFALLLPPIVFSVGYSIRKAYFFENIGLIVFLGVVATILTICLFSLFLITANSAFSLDLSSRDILQISTVMSSIDPISALPLFRETHGRLSAVVSGESVINSAVVIILFGTASSLTVEEYSMQVAGSLLLSFSYRFTCSFLMGVAGGLALSLLFRRVVSLSTQPIKESSLILLTGYTVYLLGEFLGLSGVIALFITAIIFSMYGYNNLSQQAKHGTLLAFQTVRYVAQAFIFTYLGASLLSLQTRFSTFAVALLLIAVVPLARLLSVGLGVLACNIAQRPFPLGGGERKMLWYCGLMRGVIAFALSLQVQSENRPFLVAVALLVVMATTITGSTLLRPFADRIGLADIDIIRAGEPKEEEREVQLMPATKYGVIGQAEEGGRVEDGQHFLTFQEKFIRPIFSKSGRGVSNTKLPVET